MGIQKVTTKIITFFLSYHCFVIVYHLYTESHRKAPSLPRSFLQKLGSQTYAARTSPVQTAGPAEHDEQAAGVSFALSTEVWAPGLKGNWVCGSHNIPRSALFSTLSTICICLLQMRRKMRCALKTRVKTRPGGTLPRHWAQGAMVLEFKLKSFQ